MDRDRWTRQWGLFHEALEKPEGERAAFVREACSGDAALRAEVEALLAAHDPRDSLLDASPVTPAPTGTDPLVGGRVGPYRILGIIGEGGMGVVYDAAQDQPLRRRVALKVIRQGMATKEVIARFEAERQALALMNHPGIAQVYDAGTTEDGRPYFVMEHVAGIPLTRYCDDGRLGTAERLRLFIEVCDAVQHAHHKGIIHRDLKPSNVLVSEQDARPVPKVIDFGVAKATQQRLTERTVYTELGRLIGTPEYMSPEQARMSELDVDTRTDVYTLGVLLYELLTGALPFESDRLRRSGYDEIQRIIREEDPQRPSSRLRTLGGEARAAVGERRRSNATAIERELRGDLDWIVMMAMEKSRGRRYQTVHALMADIERYLASEPVVAGAPGTLYRVRKFYRRHRLGVTAAAIAGVVVVGFASVMTWQSIRLARALDEKESERQKAAQLSSILVEQVLTLPDPDLRKGESVTVSEVLEQADRIAESLRDEPELRATVMDAMGRVYLNLGLFDRAEEILNEVLDTQRALYGERHADVATTMNRLAGVLGEQSRLEEAEGLARDALAMRRSLQGEESLEIAESLNDLGLILWARSEYGDAEELIREALAIRERLVGPNDEQVAQAKNNLGIILRRRGDYDGAEENYREALAAYRKIHGASHRNVAMVLNNLALLLHVKGEYAASEPMFREGLAMRRDLLGAEHPLVALTQSNYAQLLRDMGNYAEAERQHREALELRRRALGDENVHVADSMSNLANVLTRTGDLDEAEEQHRSALAIREKVLGNDHSRVAMSLSSLGNILTMKGELDEAESLLQRSLEMNRRIFGDEHSHVADQIALLANVDRDRGDVTSAETHYRDALERRRALLGEHADVARVLIPYGRMLAETDRPEEGETLLREASGLLHRLLPDDNRLVALADSNLGGALLARERFDEAERMLERSHEILEAGGIDGWTRESARRLARLYRATGRADRAAAVEREAGL